MMSMSELNTNMETNKEQLYMELYKKHSKLAWYASERASATLHKAWEKCYALALMAAPLPECEANINELFYACDKRIKRIFPESVNIAYACSEQFAPFCGVSVFSLIANSDKCKNYDILIMHAGNLSELNKKHLCALAAGKPNISIRIINCAQAYIVKECRLRSYFSAEVYFRCLLMTDFFAEYDRFVYLDSDTIINTDISALYNRNISGKSIAAVSDLCMQYLVNSGANLVLNGTLLSYKYYISRFLSLDNSSQYFNSGVMLMDTGKIRTDGLCSEVFAMLQSGDYYCFEQCVLNKVFKNSVERISQIWNVQDITNVYGNCNDHISENTLSHLKWCIPRYKIMHYIGPDKPWYKPDAESSRVFTAYAYGTVWFRTIIYASLADRAEEFLQHYHGRPG